MYNFDENTLVNELAKLPPHGRIAFAAAAATRQLGNYEWYARRFNADGELRPREIANQLWDALSTDSIDRTTWASALDEVMSLLPEEGDDWLICHALADDALASLAYAVRALLTPDPQEVAWAARRAYEAADQAAIRTLGLQPGLPDTEIAIKSHPLVQREIVRQRRDFDFLLAKPGKDSIDAIRNSAFTEVSLTDKEQEFLD
jgi:uncharacterized protein YjaG (DUF416 family)